MSLVRRGAAVLVLVAGVTASAVRGPRWGAQRDHAALISEATRIVESAIGPAPTTITRPQALRTSQNLAGRIDHTLLKADATADKVMVLCAEARDNGFASVCVNTRWVPLAAAELADSPSLVCTVVGFPLGAMAAEAKAAEVAIAVAQGATEVDMVIDIGGLLSNAIAAVYQDMVGVAQAAGAVPVKVILETCLLSDLQKVIGCVLAVRAGLAYVKTSTGMSTGGATVEDIQLMREVVGDELGVKASGAIRSRDDVEKMLAAGADRIGASASVAIIAGEDAGQGDY